MDNFPSYPNFSVLPATLGSLLSENNDVMDYFNNMDDSRRTELINYADQFQSKEELERYLYYMTDENFR